MSRVPAANVVVLRTEFSGDMQFEDLLDRVHATVCDSFLHADLPFPRLLEILDPLRDPSYSPLFQVALDYPGYPDSTVGSSMLSPESVPIETGGHVVDLRLAFRDRKESITGELEYNAELFDPATVNHLVGHFRVLMDGLVTDPCRRISEYSILTKAEQVLLLKTWNSTDKNYPVEIPVHRCFEQQAELRPDAVAVVFEGESLTYRELNQRANRLAHFLRRLGVAPGALVAIHLDRSLEMIVGILAVLKAGGAYLPLDPTYPVDRLAYMIDDANAPVLLTHPALAERLPACRAHVVLLDKEIPSSSAVETQNPPSLASLEDLAYVIYTSGSTGKPKGTLIEHRGVSNLTNYLLELYRIQAESRILQFAAFGFDASVTEIFPPLVAGATLVLAPHDQLTSPEGLKHVLRSQAIEIVTLAPSLLAILDPGDLPDLKTIISAGEPCFWDIVAKWEGGRRFINGYGPTETTVAASYYVADGQPACRTKSVPIGRPMANTQIYILDPNLQPVPIGVTGELHVGGVGLARGYLNRPELTDDKFIPNPFSCLHGSRLYKTGDLARYLPDGNIEFQGRIDYQVKLRGFRIELGEVENRIKDLPGVANCVVDVREDQPGDRRMVAYLIGRSQLPLPLAEIRRYLMATLPGYMVPHHLMQLDSFPLTPSGKVDRRALPEPAARKADTSAFLEPRTDAERAVARVWSNLLRVEPIGVKDNFFELGGDSLLVIRMTGQMEEHFQRALSVADIYQHPTVEQLAAFLTTSHMNRVPRMGSSGVGSVIKLKDGDRPPIFILPGNMGNVYKDLAYLVKHLPDNISLFGLQDNVSCPSSIPKLAACFLTDILRVQTSGPYHLIGICSGAVLAFEISQQLLRRGQEVALLAMIEPCGIPSRRPSIYADVAMDIVRRIIGKIKALKHQATNTTSNEKSEQLKLLRKVFFNILAVSTYSPKMLHRPFHLFLTEGSVTDREWLRMAKARAVVHGIPGTHRTITGDMGTEICEEEMKALAVKISTLLEQPRMFPRRQGKLLPPDSTVRFPEKPEAGQGCEQLE